MRIEEVIQQMATERHTTPEKIRREMDLSMKEAQKSTNPRVRALWASIPRKGKEITLEEFIESVVMVVSAIS